MDHDVVPIGASCVGLVLSALGHEPRIALMTSGNTVGRLKKRTGAVREKGEVARNMIVMAMCSGLHAVHRSSWYDRKVPQGSRSN